MNHEAVPAVPGSHALCQEQKYDNATLARKLKAKQAGEGMEMVRLASNTNGALNGDFNPGN